MKSGFSIAYLPLAMIVVNLLCLVGSTPPDHIHTLQYEMQSGIEPEITTVNEANHGSNAFPYSFAADPTADFADTKIPHASNAQIISDPDGPNRISFTVTTDPRGLWEGYGPTPIQVTVTLDEDNPYTTVQLFEISVSNSTPGTVGFMPVPDFVIELLPGTVSATGTFTLTPIDNTIREVRAIIQILANLNGITGVGSLALLDNDIENERIFEVNSQFLPEMTQAFSASIVNAISSRIASFSQQDGASSGNVSQMMFGRIHGRQPDQNRYPLPRARPSAWRQHLDGQNMVLNLRDRISVWLDADYRSISGVGSKGGGSFTYQYFRGRSLPYDGRVIGIHTGLDLALSRGLLIGLSASRMHGRLNYVYIGENRIVPDIDPDPRFQSPMDGITRGSILNLSPYVSWSWSSGSNIWVMASRGYGDMRIADAELQREKADARLQSVAAGTQFSLLPPQMNLSIAFKAAGWLSHFKVLENTSRVVAMEMRVYRTQISLETSYRFSLPDGGYLQPFAEFGARADIGDGNEGYGLETVGGARLDLPSKGLRISGQGRVLLHHYENVQEWGYGGSIRYAPRGNRGLSMALTSSVGDMYSGIQQAWLQGDWQRIQTMVPRWRSDVGYGFDLPIGIVTPYGGFTHGHRLQGNAGIALQKSSRFSMRMEVMQDLGSASQIPQIRGLITLR